MSISIDQRLSRSALIPACVVAAGLCLASGIATAAPPNPNDLTEGNWVLQVSQSKWCKEGPRQSSREIVNAGWGLVSTHWTGVDAKGAPVDIRYVYRYDGEKYPADISKPADVAISWKLVNPRQVEFTDWSKDGKPIARNVRTVSQDGQTMTQKTRPTGQDCEDVQVFSRQ